MSEDSDPDDAEDHFIGWSAIEAAALAGHLAILTRLGPDPARDDFDSLYQSKPMGIRADRNGRGTNPS